MATDGSPLSQTASECEDRQSKVNAQQPAHTLSTQAATRQRQCSTIERQRGRVDLKGPEERGEEVLALGRQVDVR